MSFYQPAGTYSRRQNEEAIKDAEEEKLKGFKLHPVILEKYRKNNYILDWFPTASQQSERTFYQIVDQVGKPVKTEIVKLIRLKKGKKEHFFYHQELISENKVGSIIHHYGVVGKYDDPTFTPVFNQSNGTIIGREIYSSETVYELEFPKDWSSKLEELVHDKVDLVAIAPTGKHYGGYTLDQFLTYSFDELVTFGKFGTLSPKARTEIEELDFRKKVDKLNRKIK